jgi:hypothetical protein
LQKIKISKKKCKEHHVFPAENLETESMRRLGVKIVLYAPRTLSNFGWLIAFKKGAHALASP